jgi:hypothetical protein
MNELILATGNALDEHKDDSTLDVFISPLFVWA